MTMLSFRVPDEDAEEARRWSETLGVRPSELLREALHRHLAALRGAHDAERWEESPMTAAEGSLGAIASWGPAEEWGDWADAPR